MFAQVKVKNAYAKWGQVTNQRNLTGIDAARIILGPEGLADVQVRGIPGVLSDNYDPAHQDAEPLAGRGSTTQRGILGDCGP